MFSYDAYKNKILRIAAIKRFIFKFKVPIIVVLSLIVASLTTFLCVKGTITSNVAVVTENIIYGENYEIKEAKALFAKIRSYEYLREGESAWSTEKPTLAGKYKVRAVTRGGFKNKRGNEVEFEILPRPVTFAILDDEIVYGSKPEDIEFPLVGTDRVSESELNYEFDGFESENTAVQVELDSVRISNSAGVDVTNCYVISSARKDVRLLNKDITLSVAIPELIYNGKEQRFANAVSSDTQYELGTDKIEFNTVIRDKNGNAVQAPVLAGKYTAEIVPDSVRINHGTENVTLRYNFSESSFEPFEFEVKRRAITVETMSAEKEYDGTELSLRSGERAYNLAEGHTLAYADAGKVSVTYAGDAVENAYEFVVFDGADDVSENYDIKYEYGTLKIIPRKIVLTAASETFEYDGEIKSNLFAAYAAGANGGAGFINAGEYASVTNFGKIIGIVDAGEVANNYAPVDYTVFNADGSENQNYEIVEVIAGTLTVTPRKIILAAPLASFEYDGEEHSATLTFEAEYYLTARGKVGFVGGESAAVTDKNKVVKVRNVSDSGKANAYLPADYTVFNADGSVSENYEIINVIAGELIVTPRRIMLTAASEIFEYDGEKHSAVIASSSKHIDGNEFGLAGADYAKVHDESKIIYVRNVADTEQYNNTYSALDYKIYDADGSDVSNNYNILSVEAGTLTVTKHSFTVVTLSKTETYNGEPLFNHEFGFSDSIIDKMGDTVVLDSSRSDEFAKLTQKGNVSNVLFVKVLRADGSDCDNYEINYTYGTLTVTERSVVIKTESGRHVYFGAEFYVKEYEKITGDGLAKGDSAAADEETVRKVLNVTSPDGVDNDTQFEIFNVAGENVTSSYNITYEYGKLIVSKRPVIITTINRNCVYNGEEWSSYDSNYSVTSPNGIADGGLVSRHILKPDENNTVGITNVGSIENKVAYFIWDAENQDVTANYDITYKYGTLTVVPQQITIISDSQTFEYDGAEHSNLRASECRSNVYSGGFVTDGEYAYVCSGKVIGITDVGTKPNDYAPSDYKVFNADGTETHNYEVTSVIAGVLTVTPREICVTTASARKVYDGEWLTCPEYETVTHVASNGTERALVLNHELKLDENSITRILHTWQSTENENGRQNVLVYFVMQGEKPIDGNYSITYVYGTLTVTPRPVSVLTSTASRVYNDEELYSGVPADYTLFDEEQKVGLLSSHRLEADESTLTKIRFAGSEMNVLEYFVFAEYSLDGITDVTRDYAVSYSYGTLTVTKRRITVVMQSVEKEYDGMLLYGYVDDEKTAAHTDNQGSDIGLVQNRRHTLSVKVEGQKNILDVGTVTNDSQVVIYSYFYNGFIEDVTDSYEIKREFGTLTVTPRLIKIYIDDISKEYDGNSYYYDKGRAVHVRAEKDEFGAVSYIEDGLFALADGHETESIGDITYVTNVWDSVERNIYDYRIIDKDNLVWNDDDIGVWDDDIIDDIVNHKDVTSNYKIIEIIAGRLEITPRTVLVSRWDKEKEYDGAALLGDEAYGDRLLEAHKFVAVSGITSITNVWESGELILTEFSVADQNGNLYVGAHRIEENYALSYNTGEGRLYIIPRSVIVVTGSAKKVYDGTPLDCDEYEYFCEHGADWIDGHSVALDVSQNVASITDAVTAENVRHYTVVSEYSNEIDGHTINENYELIYVYGTLEIERRNIIVSTASAEKVYDGTPLEKAEWTISENTPFDLLDGHKLILSNTEISSLTNADSIDNVLWLRVENEENEDFTSNYFIFYLSGILKVIPRTVYVKPKDVFTGYGVGDYTNYYEYYGESRTNPDKQFVEGESLVINAFADENGERFLGATAGVYNIYLNPEYCLISGGNGRMENYRLICEESGRFEREKRGIVAFAPIFAAEYNGKEHRADLGAYLTASVKDENELGFLNSDFELIRPVYAYFDLQGNRISAPVHAGSYIVRIEGFENATDVDVLSNYEYNVSDFTDGSLTVNKRAITVKPADGSKSYDGVAVRFGEWRGYNGLSYIATIGSVISGDSLDLQGTFRGVINYASGAVTISGEESVTESAYYFVDLDADYAAANNPDYEITVLQGRYNIAARVVRVKNSSFTAEYNGEQIFVPSIIPAENVDEAGRAFIESMGHRLELSGEFGKTDAGVYSNSQSIRIFNGEIDCTHNYSLKCSPGTLTITPRTLTFTFFFDSYEKEYDGKPFVIGDDDYDVEGFVDGHSLDKTVLKWTEMVNAGTYEYKILRAAIKSESGQNIRPANYVLKYIRPAPVVISPKLLVLNVRQDEREYNGEPQPLMLGEVFSCAPDSEPLENVIKSFKWRVYSGGVDFDFIDAGEFVLSVYKSEIEFDGIKNNPNYYISEDELFTFNFTIDKYNLMADGRYTAISSYNESRLYDGTPLFSTSFTKVLPSDFPANHDFKISSYPSVTYPHEGKVKNILGFIICDETGADVSSNYNLEELLASPQVSYGSLEVTGDLKLYPEYGADIIYDGAIHERGGQTYEWRVRGTQTNALPNKHITFRADIAEILYETEIGWTHVEKIENAGNYRIYYKNVTLLENGRAIAPEVLAELNIVTPPQSDGSYMFEKTIHKRVIYVRPKSKTVVYDGTDIIEADKEVDVFYGSVISGHKYIAEEFSDVLDATRRSYSNVTILKGRIESENSWNADDSDVSRNYEAYLTYDEYKTPYAGKYDFRATLQFKLQTVTVLLIAPEKNTYVYDGDRHEIPFDPDKRYYGNGDVGENDALKFEFVGAGLLRPEHYLKVTRAYVSADPYPYNGWLTLKAYEEIDGVEKEIKAYSVKTTYNENSYVTVVAADVNISIDESGNVGASVMRNDGLTKLSLQVVSSADNVITYECALTTKYTLRIINAGGVLSHKIFRLSSGKEIEADARYFNVKTETGAL